MPAPVVPGLGAVPVPVHPRALPHSPELRIGVLTQARPVTIEPDGRGVLDPRFTPAPPLRGAVPAVTYGLLGQCLQHAGMLTGAHGVILPRWLGLLLAAFFLSATVRDVWDPSHEPRRHLPDLRWGQPVLPEPPLHAGGTFPQLGFTLGGVFGGF